MELTRSFVTILFTAVVSVCAFNSSAQTTAQRQKNIDADNILLSVFETGDISKLDAIIAPNFLNHAGRGNVGLDSLKSMVKGFHARMPNVKLELIRQFADDDYVSDWVRFNNPGGVAMEGMEITKYVNGKAVEHWFFSNPQGVQQRQSAQAGAVQKKYQAKAPTTQPFGKEAFTKSNSTTIRWLGMAGFFINSRGTTMMVDPLLDTFDMPLLIKFPITSKDVPKLDAVLVTHADNDHFSIPTNRNLKTATREYHSTVYVDSLMKNEGLPSFGHDIGQTFKVGNVSVKLTTADHAYQNAYPGMSKRHFKNEDACGFMIETPDGTIWAPGDSRLLPEHLKYMPPPDAIFFDFSDSEWHFTFEGAVKIANAYPNTPLLLCHWGSVDSPDFAPFNADPEKLKKAINNPGRIQIIAPGQPFTITKLKASAGKK